MKRFAFYSLMVVFAVCTSVAVNAQEVGAAPAVVNTNGAQIKVDKEVHDYGIINQNEDGKCEFKVTNTGNAPLIISKCKGSCGCTVPTCTQEPIAPGASTMITVEYDTKTAGPINKSVTIYSNAANEPTKTLRIKGNVRSKPAKSTTP
jgi:hypothetical protein